MESSVLTNACQGCKARDEINLALAHRVDELTASNDELLRKVRELTPKPRKKGTGPKSIIKTPLGRTRKERKERFKELSENAG